MKIITELQSRLDYYKSYDNRVGVKYMREALEIVYKNTRQNKKSA